MNPSTSWLALITGTWTVDDDPCSGARRVLRAGRAWGLSMIAVGPDERCLARLAAGGWTPRLASGPDPAALAEALTSTGDRGAPALLLADGPGLSTTTASTAALLGIGPPGPLPASNGTDTAGRRGTAGTRRFVAQAQDGAVVGIVEDVTAGGSGRDYDCPGAAVGRTARTLHTLVRETLLTVGLTRGPAEVTVLADGRDRSVVDIAPGRIDACVASAVELATGHDPVLAAVRAAVAGARPARRGPAYHRGMRHACVRRADLRGERATTDAAWVGLPGLVTVRPGRDGAIVAVADDRDSAVRAAESALERLAGRGRRATDVAGVIR